MKKRIFVIIVSFVIFIAIIAFLITKFGNGIEENNKPTIFTTIYPEYDFVSHIVKDKMEVKRLIGPGVEIHTYEPSSKDMINIAKSDLFVYTGDVMEPWAKSIIESIRDYDVKILDTSKNINMIDIDKFMEEYSLLDNINNENSEHQHEELDGHIWMNPQNAIIMIDTILEEIIKIDPDNREFYEENALQYKNQISDLDKKIEETLKKNNINVLVFGGEFSYSYFCQRYNLNIISCYTACGEHQDPSISRVQDVIDYIKNNNVSSIYYEELSEGQISQMISEETNAKAKVFNTLHNVTLEEIDNNEDYVTIMMDNLKKIIE